MTGTASTADLLTEAEAAELLRVKPDTLRHWRMNARPNEIALPYVQRGQGRVLYLRADLVAWIEAHRHVPATTESSQ